VSWLWVVPIAVVTVGAVMVMATLRRVDTAARDLRRELGRAQDLSAAITGLRHQADDLSTAAASLRHRAPRLRR
jgi:cytochrome c-type biogenesis protein CcmH/NrfF